MTTMREAARTSASLKALPLSIFQPRILNMAGVTPCTVFEAFSLPTARLKPPCSTGAAPASDGSAFSAAASAMVRAGAAPLRMRCCCAVAAGRDEQHVGAQLLEL